MKYDIKRLEADYIEAQNAWRAAVEEHHTPRECLDTRQARDNALMDRMRDLGQVLNGVRHGFGRYETEERILKMEAILKDYEVKE